MEDITDAEYVHSKRVCKDFGIKKLDNIMIVSSKRYIIVSWYIWKYVWKYIS